MKSASLFRYARALKEAVDASGERRELWPVSGPGGGKNAAHPTGSHLANLMLSLVAIQPADAVRVVDELRTWQQGLSFDAAGKPYEDHQREDANLGHFLQFSIETLACVDTATRRQWAVSMAEGSLSVNLERGVAMAINFSVHQSHSRMHTFLSSKKSGHISVGKTQVQRIVQIPLSLIAVAADLLADIAHSNKDVKTAAGKLMTISVS